MDNYLLFESGIDYNRVFAHRGDIFICEGLFKPMSDIEENDHIIAKPNRPVLIISDDIHNADIVKVLPFSTKAGSLDQESITFHDDVFNGYEKIVEKYKDRMIIVDASQDVEKVIEDAYKAVMEILNA